MDTADKKLAYQVQFWGLIGPLIALITLLVILIKSPSQAIYLSTATILGLISSWKWKAKGAVASLGLMLLLYLYQFSEITPDEHLWHIGMNFAIVMGFAITALCFDEIEKLLHHTDVKLTDAELAQKNEKLEFQVLSYENLVENVKEETLKINHRNEKLVEELLLKQQNLSALEEKIKSLVHLEAAFELKEKEVAALKTKLEENPAKIEPYTDLKLLDELKSNNDLLSRERGRLESLLFRTQIDLHQKTQELADFPKLKADLEVVQQTLKEAEVREQEFENRLYEKAMAFDTHERALKDEIAEKNTKLKAIDNQLQAIKQEKENLNRTFQTTENALTEELNQKNTQLQALSIFKAQLEEAAQQNQKLEEHLQKTEHVFKEEINQKNQQLQVLNVLEKQLEEANQHSQGLETSLTQLRKDLEKKQTQPEVIPEEIDLPKDATFEFKKMAGKYKQLRQQFEEKSDLLHETRKELFRKEEDLSSIKLQLDELLYVGFAPSDAHTQNYVLKLIDESNRSQQEIDHLHAIISTLSK